MLGPWTLIPCSALWLTVLLQMTVSCEPASTLKPCRVLYEALLRRNWLPTAASKPDPVARPDVPKAMGVLPTALLSQAELWSAPWWKVTPIEVCCTTKPRTEM